MLIYFTTRVISSTTAFLYPGYASYKTLSQRPASEAELERWLMYWSVLGCIVGVEYVAEWLISWIPLYYPIKTIFLLYLSLPQTRGSSYIYVTHLQPFFHYYESDIDATLIKLKTRVYTFAQEKLHLLWEQIMGSLGHAADPSAAASATQSHTGPNATAAQSPTMGDPVSGPAQLLGGLWRSYGPTIVASGAALLRQSGQASGAGTAFFSVAGAPAPSKKRPQAASRQDTTQSVLERRRQLEAELASLPPFDELPLSGSRPSPHSSSSDSLQNVPETIPVRQGSSAYLPTSTSASEADLRARVASFEEVEVPSDVEGYDIGGGVGSGSPSRGAEPGRPSQDRRTSWFGWGSAPTSPAAAVDKGVKND